MGAFAWVTMVTNDSYSLGALVLAHSLRRVATQADLAVLVTPGVTPSMREKLAAVYNVLREVNVLDSQDETNLSVLKRPELGITFTKLHCWRLTQYEKCVFLDADTLVVRNCDELFEREELSAARDVGWPDCFNSGVFVFKPSEQTFASITAFAVSQGSFDGADQGLLNSYFSDWGYKDMSKHLPFIYNMCSIATYSYPPAFKQFGANVKIIHFIGATKPWVQYFDTMTGIVQTPAGCEHLHPLLQLWWNIFCENVHPQLTDVMGGLAGALSKLTMGEYRTEEQRAIEDHMRKQNWEQGQIDFMGRDSFDNILKKINETLSTVPPVEESPVKETRQPKKTSGQSSKVEATVGESETSLPVLETEDQLKLYTTQELSEDKCQNISEDASSLIKYEQPITISSAISEVDNTSREKILASSQNILEEPEKSVPIAQSSDVPKNTAQESTESKTVLSEMNQDFQLTKTEESEVDKTQSKIDETIEKLVISADTTASILSGLPETEKIEVTSPTQETKPQIVSEATTECPVPIQVAESVLQAEPKESVSEDPRPIIEAVASSIIPSLQESATTISEALIQPDQNVSLEQLSQPQQINGHDPSLELYAEKNVSPVVNESLIICPNISSAVHESVVSQQQDNQSSIQQTLSESENKLQDLESGSAQSTDISLEKPELSTEKPKLTVVLPQTETTINKSSTTEPKLTVVLPQTETTINKSSTTEPTQVIQSEPSTDIEPVAADSGAIPVLLTKEPPVRPIRSKDLKIPGTPTVTEPTPPTSPPVETGTTTVIEEKPQKETQQATEASIEIKIEVESTEKSEAQSQKPLESQQTAKKEQELAKKSSIESDTPSSPESEGSAKKVVKKKKVKKPEESGDSESSSSPGKPKKGTKTGKKLAKIPSTSLETDTTVPETSPPSQSSDAPVPPKRKSKSSSSTKVIDKKSDEPTKQ